MKIYKYIFSIIISFIIISLIILFLISLLSTKIDTFAIDVININAGDTTDLLPTLSNKLLIYLKFNNNNLTTNSGRHSINATNIDTNTRFSYQNTNIILNNSTTGFNGCIINTTDYVRGNASIQFNGSSGIIQSMNSDFINTNFTVAFYLKNVNNTTGNKTIVAQALQNPTLGWMIRLENSSLKVILGNNTNNNWTTIITVPNFINSTTNNWYHIALTYEQSANPKWNLYLDGTKFTTSSTDNPNQELKLLSTQVSTSITNSSGSKTIKMRNFGNNMHFLTIGCELITIVRTIVDTSSITTDSTYLDIGLENGIKGVNYDYGYAETGYFYIKFLSGTTTLNLPSRCTNVEILVVGGGGGGGSRHAGGGGAGAVIYLTNQTLEIGSYNIYVGNGGNWINRHGQGGRGENTSVVFNNANLYLAQGGGGGNHAIDTGNSNKDGGSGGGHGGGNGGSQDWINRARGFAVTNNIPSGIYGNNSGLGTWGGRERYWGGGGGGGAGSVGADSIHSNDRSIAGNGGDGIQISITGQPLYYGGGGGGGCAADSTSAGRGGLGGGGDGSKGFENAAIDGTPNTGGGGGGAGFQGGRNGRSGSGGSGVVIFKFRISDFLVNNQILYRNEEPSTFRLGNFLPNQTLMDDFRFYNATLTENQIKTIYYGTLIASINITNNQINDSTDCVPNELAANANLIAIPSSSGLVTNISGITTTTLNTPSTSQFRQTFKLNTYRGNENTSNIELLFSQPLFSTITPNPYSPVKLFNKDSIPSNANNNINYCAFLSTYALNTINDNYVYNYNKDGTYALTSFSVPDCGNIRFNNNARPKGDYIYIKFPESFALLRYAFTAISGFTSRAPAKWTLYIYNQSTSSNISYTYPSSGNPLSVRNYCQTNQRVFMVDMLTNQIISNEYLFVFHNIVGNNRNDNFGMLAFQEMVLYKNNPILT